MDKLIYKRGPDEWEHLTEMTSIEFEVFPHLNIWELKTICMRMASALGYHPNSIERAFGKAGEDNVNDIDLPPDIAKLLRPPDDAT